MMLRISLASGLFFLCCGTVVASAADEIPDLGGSELERVYEKVVTALVNPETQNYEFWHLPRDGDYLEPYLFKTTNYGLTERNLFQRLHVEFLYGYVMAHEGTQEDLVGYLSSSTWRKTNIGYAMKAALEGDSSVDPAIAEDLRVLADRFRVLERDRDLVAHHRSFSQEERLALLNSVNQQLDGLALGLKSVYRGMLSGKIGSEDFRRSLRKKFLQAVQTNIGENRSILTHDLALTDRMSAAIFEDEPRNLGELAERCRKVGRWISDSWAIFLESVTSRSYVEPRSGLSSDSLAFRAYEEDRGAFDRCILRLYQVASSVERHIMLVQFGMEAFGPAYAREKKRLKGRHDLLFIEALIQAMDEFAAALRWSVEGPGEILFGTLKRRQRFYQRIKTNSELFLKVWWSRARLTAEAASASPAQLYFVPEVNAEGEPEPRFAEWLLGYWLLPAEIEDLSKTGRVVNYEGKQYLLPEVYAFRTIRDSERLRRYKAVQLFEVSIR